MGAVRRRQLKKSPLSEAITKKGRQIFLQQKIGWHPSVAAPGDTNPSDATGRMWLWAKAQRSGADSRWNPPLKFRSDPVDTLELVGAQSQN